jgi:hypothetical protein
MDGIDQGRCPGGVRARIELPDAAGNEVAHHGPVEGRDIGVRGDDARAGAAANQPLVRKPESGAAEDEEE